MSLHSPASQNIQVSTPFRGSWLYFLSFFPPKNASEAELMKRGHCASYLHSESALWDQIANKAVSEHVTDDQPNAAP